MRLVMVSAAWRRYAVTQLALAQRAHLCGELAGRGLEATSVIVADDENLEIARSFGFHAVEQSNDYLGRKFNDGLEYALMELEADLVVLIGSDDWVHPELFDILPRPVAPLSLPTPERPVVIGRPGPEALTGTEIALVDLPTGRVRTCRAQGRLGVIPWVFPRKALLATPRPLPDEQQKGIDGALWRGLKVRPQWVWHDPHPFCRVDLKSDVNLNSFNQISAGIGYGPEYEINALRRYYPAELVSDVLSVHDSWGVT